MVETLLVVAIALLALVARRLGVLLRHGEEGQAYLEARLEERIHRGVKETAKAVQDGTAASVASLGEALLAQLAQERLGLEQRLDAVAKQLAETSRTSGERLEALSRQIAETRRTSGERLEALAKQVVEAGRSSGEALDAIALRTGEEALRTRRDLLEALATLQPSLDEALGEMRAIQEQAVRELRRPMRHAVAIRQEIRRAREEQARPALEAPLEPTALTESARVEEDLDRILGPELAEEGPPLVEAGSPGAAAGSSEVPDAPAREPVEPAPSQARPAVAAPRPRRLSELLSRVQRRARRTSPSPPDTRAGH